MRTSEDFVYILRDLRLLLLESINGDIFVLPFAECTIF